MDFLHVRIPLFLKVRPEDRSLNRNARRAAPPWWGSVAALPRPSVPAAGASDSHVEVQAPWPISNRAPSLGSGTRTPARTGGSTPGAKVPIRLTVRQEEYCRQAIDIHRFCYNLAVPTHRFCRRNRLTWPSWMDISKAFNACKREDYPFVTQVAAVVATGAFRDFGQAVDNWRNPELRARVPKTKRPAFAGTGSFLAAGSMKEVRYDGKRRVKLPCLGSVKLGCTLPRGICYEASIRRENGRWYICLKLWRPPEPKPERASKPGGIDTGINPLGTDSDGQTYRNPKASYEVQKKLRRWQRAQARRQKGSGGWWEAQRKIDKCHRRIRGLRHNAQHQMTSTVTKKFSELVIEDLNVAGLMRGNTPRAQADAGMGGHQAAADLQGPVAAHPGDPGTDVVPQQQDLQRLRHREPQPETGTHVDLPRLRDPA